MTNLIPLYLQETLDNSRIELLNNFIKIKNLGFYLAGGTSLALQFGHRKSIDFDFFINKDFSPNELFDKMLDIFENKKIKMTFFENNTLYIEVEGIKISFFSYKYELISPLIKSDFFDLASLYDIAAMKIWAIQKRATNKDYVDIYYIIQKIGIQEFINSFFKKFGNIITTQIILKSLIYFEDITQEELILTDSNLSFDKIEKYLIEEVKKYD